MPVYKCANCGRSSKAEQGCIIGGRKRSLSRPTSGGGVRYGLVNDCKDLKPTDSSNSMDKLFKFQA
jgi:hypothetical protein